MWASYHIGEDRKQEGEERKAVLDLILSFVNPQMFKEFRKKNSDEEIVSDTFDDDLMAKTGLSREQAFERAKNAGDRIAAETIEPDIFGEPIVATDG